MDDESPFPLSPLNQLTTMFCAEPVSGGRMDINDKKKRENKIERRKWTIANEDEWRARGNMNVIRKFPSVNGEVLWIMDGTHDCCTLLFKLLCLLASTQAIKWAICAHIWITGRVIRKSRQFFSFSFVVFHFSFWSSVLCARVWCNRAENIAFEAVQNASFKFQMENGCWMCVYGVVWEGTVAAADKDNVVDDKVGVGVWDKPLFALFYYLSNAIWRLQWNFHIIERAFNVALNTINCIVTRFSCIGDKNQIGNNRNFELMTLVGAMIDAHSHRIQYVWTKCSDSRCDDRRSKFIHRQTESRTWCAVTTFYSRWNAFFRNERATSIDSWSF